MLILAVETSADLCSVAVCDDHVLLAERTFRHRMHLSERLIGDIDAVVRDAETTVARIDALAVDVGPGSFTGVRIGVTTVKVFSDVLGKQVCGVSSLATVAEAQPCVEDPLMVPLIRARPGSVYAAFYKCGAELLERRPPAEYTMAELVAALCDGESYVLCGEGLTRAAEALQARVGSNVLFGRAEPPRARRLADVARRRLERGDPDDALSLVPLYIAPPPIDPRAEQSQPS